MLQKTFFLIEAAVANCGVAMEADTISKNGRSLKSQMSRGNFLRKIFFAVLSAVFSLAFVACNKDDNGKKINPDANEIYVLDISEESDWNYMIVGGDGSSIFYSVDDDSNIPTHMFCKPNKNSDEGYTILFQENGLPEILVIKDHMLYFGNFRENKYDVALINPDKSIEYLYDVESNVDWNTYLNAAGMRASMLRSEFSQEDKIKLEHSIKYVGNTVGAIACVGGLLGWWSGIGAVGLIGCGTTAISIWNDYIGPHFDLDHVGIGALSTLGGTLATLVDCSFGNKASCLLGMASSAAGSVSMAIGQVNEKVQEIAEATGEISGGKGDVKVTLTWNNKVDLDLHIIDPNGERIYYAHPYSASGGLLDFDNVTGYGPENIYWPAGKAPNGTYFVYVHFYGHAVDITNTSSYTIKINAFGSSQTFNGTVSYDQAVSVANFHNNGLINSAQSATLRNVKQVLDLPRK